MRNASLLTISCSIPCISGEGLPNPLDANPSGHVTCDACWEAQPRCGQKEWQTPVKTSPCPKLCLWEVKINMTCLLFILFLFFHLSRSLNFIIHWFSRVADSRVSTSLMSNPSFCTAMICIALLEIFPANSISSLPSSAGDAYKQEQNVKETHFWDKNVFQ